MQHTAILAFYRNEEARKAENRDMGLDATWRLKSIKVIFEFDIRHFNAVKETRKLRELRRRRQWIERALTMSPVFFFFPFSCLSFP